jgi:hypothetical protein
MSRYPLDSLLAVLQPQGFPHNRRAKCRRASVSQLATKADIASLKVDVETLRRDMIIRLGSMIVLSVGVILGGVAAVLRLLH